MWVADADGANPRQITRGPRHHRGGARWSPDGRRLVYSTRNDEERSAAVDAGYDLERVLNCDDLVRGEDVFFSATGVTDGTLMRGVRFFGDGTRTSSIVMQSDPARIRFIDTIHVEQKRMVRIRF